MNRHHTIWDAELGRQIDIEFTAEEEAAWDLEVLVNKKAQDEARKQDLARTSLSARLDSDSATLKDVLAFLRSKPI